MGISSIQSQQASSLEELLANGKKQKEDENLVQSKGVYSWKEDSVSFSTEALTKAYSGQNGENSGGDSSFGGSGQAAGGGGGASAASSTDESIEKQIEALQQKISAIQSSSMPEDSKNAMIGALQGQIAALMAQLNASA